jgi:hypothetical protein
VYDLAALIPVTRATWLLAAVALTALFFALFAPAARKAAIILCPVRSQMNAWLFTGLVLWWFGSGVRGEWRS